MTTQSKAQTSPETSGVPAIRSFEFDDTAVGNIKTSVNQFRGTLSLPIDLLKLDGRADLDVSISALYSSTVGRNIKTWNADEPTGILGLGWSMPFEKIVVDTTGNGSPTSDRFYLISGGSADELIRTGTSVQGLWEFELRQFQFWQITYDPNKYLWRIVKENGSIYSYGQETQAANAVQWGVRWGNWMGSSSRLDGQEHYARAWNLASIESVLGDRVTYDYRSTDVAVSSQYGKSYTQASYVDRITDSLGRVIRFHYGDKFGAQNPSAQNITEYQATNADRPEPNAYQDIYETLFLERIEVDNAEGRQIHGLTFTYDFVNFADTTDPNHSLMYKRVLSSVFQWSPEGRVLPSMAFTYNTSHNDTNPGALSRIVYPGGGEATVAYKELVLDAPRKTDVRNPFTGGRPAVWHGSDYVVTAFTGSAGFRCQVSSWSGRWITTDVTPDALVNATIDPDSLWAYADADYLAISGRETTGNRDFLCLFRKSETVFGNWDLDQQGIRWLAVKAGSDTRSTFIAGRDFVIAGNTDYTSQIFQGYSWDWRSKAWIAPPLLPSQSNARVNSNFAMAAFDNAYVAAIYKDSSKQTDYQVFYRDAEMQWRAGGQWTTSNTSIILESGKPLFSVMQQTNYLATTYVTATSKTSISYTVAIHQMDAQFLAINGPSPKLVSGSAPIANGEAVFNVFQTVASQDYMNNNLLNLRNEGGDQLSSANTNWIDKTLTLNSGDTPVLASQTDVTAYLQNPPSGGSRAEIWKFDPNQPASAAWMSEPNVIQSGTAATVFDNYLTIGDTVYFNRFDGSWRSLTTSLGQLGPEASVQNRAPNYIAYQDGEDGSTRSYVVAPKNGDIGAAMTLPGGPQKVWVPEDQAGPGSNLAGLRFLVTYSSAEDFKSASSLTLYNLDQGYLSDFSIDTPVAWTAIANPFDASQRFVQSYIYGNSAQSVVAYDTRTGLAQYPKVTVVVGAETLQNTVPSSTPYGRSEFFYSNGISPQDTLNYPLGWDYNYAQILNGVQLAKRDYDENGTLVAHQLNYWKVFSTGPGGRQLAGSYAKAVRTSTTRDGVTVESYSNYDQDCGLETLRSQSYFDSRGTKKWLSEALKYAFQVTAYQSQFTAQHYFSALAKHDRCVVDDASGNKTYIESKVTTWKDWAHSGGKAQLAKADAMLWKAESASPDFDFGSSTHDGWVCEASIVSRTANSALITEQTDVRGAPSSFIFDKDSRYLVATFPGASRAAGQASYWGAEPYEDADGWVMGRCAGLVPQAAGEGIDAHTGAHAVQLDAGALGANGLQRSWVAHGAGTYVAAAWVKRPTGYVQAQGAASVTITVNGTLAARAEFTGELDTWQYLAVEFEMTAAASSVVITYDNPNTETDVLVDNLCVAPKDCTWSATSFDTRLWLPDARLEANGVTSRMRYDPFGRVTLRTNAVDSLSEIASPYQSRDGNLGDFNPADPDAVSVLRPTAAGTLDTFNRGNEWRKTWMPGNVSDWKTANGGLNNLGAVTRTTLTTTKADPAAGYALGMQFRPQGSPVMALGIQIGADVTIQWDPTTGTWSLTGPGKTVKSQQSVTSHNPALQLNLPEDEARGLAAGGPGPVVAALHAVFAQRGIHVPRYARVIDNPECGSYEINVPESQYRIVMRPTDTGMVAERLGGLWSLYVHNRSLVFRIDGKVIFSRVFDKAITGDTTLFFNSGVEIMDLALGGMPAAAVNYTDTTGNPLQQQGLEDERMTVSQFLCDAIGRAAVKAKPIWVDAASTTPLLAYTPGVATLDWTTGHMTGLIAAAYPADGGFPYAREIYEPSPLGRVIASGLPGAEFAVGANAASMTYGPNPGVAGLPANSYTRQVAKDANGNVSGTISTSLGQTVMQTSERSQGHAVTSTVIFDDAGNPVEQRLPNYFEPPQASVADDWIISQTFDYAGRPLTKTIGRLGTSQMIYSDAGDLRFMSDPEGQADGTYLYWKYDRLGRPIENGYVDGVFDPVLLSAKANSDPDWPTTATTWRKKQQWDGAGVAANAIGRLRSVQTSQETNGSASATEEYIYDLFGNTTRLTQKIAGILDERRTDYAFDMQGAPVTVTYPRDAQGDRWKLTYRYDPLGRVTSISEGDRGTSELISYAYQADGRPLSETRPGDGSDPSSRAFEYNPPLWPTRLHDSTAANALFIETLSYTSGGYQGAGYYDGSIAAADYPDAGGAPGHEYKYAYNGLGELEQAECPQQPEWSLGGAVPIDYDANGNVEAAGMGTRDIRYDYIKQTQRLKKIEDVTDGTPVNVAEYSYNKNGAALTSKTVGTPFAPATDIHFDYDSGVRRPVRATPSGKDAINYRYGPTGGRVVKDVDISGGGPAERTTYTQGVDGQNIFEQAPRDEMFYGFGPQGLELVRHNGDVLYILRDHLGSVRRLLDKTNAVVADFDYLPFGTVARSGGARQDATNRRFTGHPFETELGLYDTRARFYSAQVGRFLDIDPMTQFFSPYTYAANNPVLYVDPDGQFSFKSLFSAIAGVIIGAVEIVIGVAIDIVAGVLEVLTGGLATGAAVALAAAAGAFYGAGASSIIYSVMNVQSFDWKEYGIQMGIGAVAGAISFGFGALGSAVATSAASTATVSAASKFTQTAVEVSIKAGFGAAGGAVGGAVSTSLNDVAHNVTPGFDVVTGTLWGALSGGISGGTSVAGPAYKSGFKEFGKRVLINVGKKEAIGISLSLTKNAVNGDPLDKGLVNTAVSGVVWGSIGSVGASKAAAITTKDTLNALGSMAMM